MMKKSFRILSVILAVAMLCVMFVLPTSAAAVAGPGISLGLDQTAFPGTQVTIPVSLTNASGIYAMNFEVALGDLENVVVEGKRADVSTNYDEENKVLKVVCNPVGINSISSGKLFSIVATVPVADTTEAYSIVAGEIVAADANEDDVTVTGDTVNVKPAVFRFNGFSLVTSDTIDIKAYFTVDGGDVSAYPLTVSYYEKPKSSYNLRATYTAEKVADKNEVFVKIPRFSFEMTRDVFIEAYYEVNDTKIYAYGRIGDADESAKVERKALSVQDYFDKVDAGITSEEIIATTEEINCIKSMANYGAISSAYFGVEDNNQPSFDTDESHSTDIDLTTVTKPDYAEGEDSAQPLVENPAVVLSDGYETLVLNNAISFKLYTEISKDATYTYGYKKVGDAEYTAIGADAIGEWSKAENTYITLKVPVSAYDLSTEYEIAAFDDEGNVISSVTYSADRYIARMWDSEITNNGVSLNTVLRAIKHYCDAAAAAVADKA